MELDKEEEKFRMLREEFRRIKMEPPVTMRQYFNRHSVPKLPELICIHYVGGPRNCEQEYFTRAAHPEIMQGAYYQVRLLAAWVPDPGFTNGTTAAMEHATYKLTFIPIDQTPFAVGTQIVIGLFQE